MANRREILTAAGAASLGLAANAAAADKAPATRRTSSGRGAFVPKGGPRIRVMVVNDLCGDIDGLFSTVHALLSPSTEIRGIVGTAAAFPGETAQKSVENAEEILRLMGLTGKVPVHLGATGKLPDLATPVDNPGSRAIIAEAMRDSPLPLYVTVGGGLTEVASALLLEPAIADRFTLVWIGGDPHPTGGAEYNYNLDPKAAQHIFNETQVPIWQVTSRGYGCCQVSDTEIQAHVAPYGAIGAWLYDKILEGIPMFVRAGLNTGESWTLGDSPLVLLTALTSWIPTSAQRPARYERTSSPYTDMIAPRLLPGGLYEPRSEGRRMRVYDSVDTRLMFGDFFAKMRMNYGR